MTYTMLLQILVEAEFRAADTSIPEDVRTRSQETVDICNLRLKNEGISRKELEKLARNTAF